MSGMLDVTTVLTSIVCDKAREHFIALYSGEPPQPLEFVQNGARAALGAISRSDALYHNTEHTAHVTLVGMEILRAKQESEGGLAASIWANTLVAMLCHDIGYVRGLCRGDTETSLATGIDGQALNNIEGSSDAVSMPVHVNRGKRYVEEAFLEHQLADVGFINACIERTRFPVPDEAWYTQTADLPGLVRAADLIGQLSDPRYLNKLAAIFYEFEEIGFNQRVGYECPGDLLIGYPAFFETCVSPYIAEANVYLQRNVEGREILKHLYSNLESAREASAMPLASAANS